MSDVWDRINNELLRRGKNWQWLADQTDYSIQRLQNWKTRGVPYEVCPAIERLTDRQVMRYDLRPNDWSEMWPELAQAPANAAQAATENVAQGVA